MKKKLGILALTAVLGTGAYGASIDHIQTYTPEYLGNQAQNGMINNVSVYYNPAGLMQLERGTYFHGGMQIAFGTEEMKYKGKKYEADLFQPIPNFALYSVRDERAIFWTFGAIGGGGDLEYKDGVAGIAVVPDILTSLGFSDTKDLGSSAEGTNMYVQNTLGRAWMINDKLSMSIAARAVVGMRNLKGNLNVEGIHSSAGYQKLHADIDSERTAWGFGGQIGFNYKASDRLNLALRYDSRVKMNFKSKGSEHQLQTTDVLGQTIGLTTFYPQYIIDSKVRRDLPAILSVGASYKITDNYLVSGTANYYFNHQARMDRVSAFGGLEHGRDYKDGWEVAFGNEYKLNNKFTLIGSINYARTGAKNASFNDTEYALNSVTLGAGVRYNFDETLAITASVAHFIYEKEEGNFKEKYKVDENQKYHKQITAMGLSITKKF